MNPLFALPLYSAGFTASEMLLYRYLFGVMILLLMIKIRRQQLSIPRKTVLPLIGLGIIMALSSLMLFASYNYIPAGIASTMLFVYPIMVAVIMSVVYHEKISLLTTVCLITAVAGIALLYKGEDGVVLNITGMVLVILSALTYALYLVWINRSLLSNIPTLTLTFYVLLFGSVVFIVPVCLSNHIKMPASALSLSCLFALGLLPKAVSLVCTTMSIQRIGSTSTAILGALEPITAIFFGYLVFNQTLTPREWIGLILILAAVTSVIAGDNVAGTLLRMRKLFPKLYHKIKIKK